MLFYRGGIIWQRKAGSPGSCSNTQLSLVGLVLLQGTKELLMNRVILGGICFCHGNCEAQRLPFVGLGGGGEQEGFFLYSKHSFRK